MKYIRLLYLIWLLPGYLLFLSIHQGAVFYSIVDTYDEGTSYVADVEEYEMKQIAAQTNGYVIIQFETKDGKKHRQKLSLPVEMAAMVSKSNKLPIRYKDDAFINIVIIPTYGTQKGLVLTNLAMALVGLFIALFVTFLVHRYVRRKTRGKNERFVIERVDNE